MSKSTHPVSKDLVNFWAARKFRRFRAVVVIHRKAEDGFEDIKNLATSMMSKVKVSYTYEKVGDGDYIFVPFTNLNIANNFVNTSKEKGYMVDFVHVPGDKK